MRPTTAIATMALVTMLSLNPVHADGHGDFEFQLREHTGEYARTWTVTRFHTFNVGRTCLARFTDRDNAVLSSASLVASHLTGYLRQLGADDWSAIEGQRTDEPKQNVHRVAKMIEPFRSRVHITINLEGEDCQAKGTAPWLRYWESVVTALESYPPAQSRVEIVLNVTRREKGLTAELTRDGVYVINAARDYEPNDWLTPLEAVFKRTTRKRL